MHCRHFFFYVAGLLTAFAYDDISFKKVATQSHTAIGLGNDASYAVDGNTETCMKTIPIGTNSPDKTVWWKVDLGGVYSIQSIHILFKNYNNYETRQKGRLAGFSLNVSISGDGVQKSTQCYKNRLELPPLNFTTKCKEFGRYVIFYNERLDGVAYPTGYELQNVVTELCEVIVQGCNNAGFYGSNCDTPCPNNCKDSTCHIQSGVCFTCKPGWTDMHCNKNDISFKKVATQSHTAIGLGNDASYAVDGNTETCMQTLPIGTNSPDKTVWWKVDLGGVYSIQSIHILFKNFNNYETRQKGRLAGFSLNVSISGDGVQKSTQCYKDRLELPPLNFTTKCEEFGRYVIFYNERLDGVAYPTGYELQNVFTELCEVIVQGCNIAGFYGSNCDTPCPTNCKDSTCHIQSGVCFTCKPGWTDMHCNKTCIEGTYGLNCNQHCVGHCRDGITCNHVTGLCDGGCTKGWRGDMCENECNEGTFGYDCVNNCSGHCLNNSPCNKQTGHCDSGCKPGYTNSDCTDECSPGYFGSNCKEQCSGQCANREPCDQFSGVCHSGCGNGYIGNNCNISCEEGHFGTNCSQVCSPNCISDTCRPTDGLCTCAKGWTGHNCSTGRTENLSMKQDIPSCTILVIGLSISISINLILISCGLLLCRIINFNRLNVSCRPVSCWKKAVYQDTFVKTEEASTYQELDLSDSAYQNTTIRGHT